MIKNIIVLLALSVILTACGNTSLEQEKNIAVQEVVVPCSDYVIIDDNIKSQVLCLLTNKMYSEAQETIVSYNKQDDAVMSMLHTFAGCMNKDSIVDDDECDKNYRDISDMYYDDDQRIILPSTLMSYYTALSGKQIAELDKRAAESQAEADKSRREYNEKYYAPSIGMTAEKVLTSTWGKPTDINKTTTKNGVHEQWVYYDRYVYLEDGIVTAIQE
ncbi:hypothetical protein [Paenibacillus endoradicis]|uniref:hypothetical protein n=1 Tax=Paenibacillus endoradicis TaxID=2972487 RepID=UPI0021593990|nr:hypothetical protein [Paenibacillus endoradicis]MCR8659316.1 hypothetical protein [Paenibacillus endoradicis]